MTRNNYFTIYLSMLLLRVQLQNRKSVDGINVYSYKSLGDYVTVYHVIFKQTHPLESVTQQMAVYASFYLKVNNKNVLLVL